MAYHWTPPAMPASVKATRMLLYVLAGLALALLAAVAIAGFTAGEIGALAGAPVLLGLTGAVLAWRLGPGRVRVYFAPIDQINDEGGREAQTCDNDAAYGNAVLYREDFADDVQGRRPHDLGTPDREGSHEKRGMACVSSASQGTVFCAAHLHPLGEHEESGDEVLAVLDCLDRVCSQPFDLGQTPHRGAQLLDGCRIHE